MKLNGAGIINMYCLFKGQNTDKAMGGKGIEILGNHIIEIPYYQRPYRWEEENITNLFNDYNDNLSKTGNPSEYFVGATVSVEDKDKTTFSLVDGQQRTTTLYLMNYVRYIIQLKLAEHTLKSNNAREDAKTEIDKLAAIYNNLIGNKNHLKFKKIKETISEECAKSLINNVEKRISNRQAVKPEEYYAYQNLTAELEQINSEVDMNEDFEM